MAGEVTFTSTLGKDVMPVTGGDQVAYVLLQAEPTSALANVRMPLNFALVIDRSGSMSGAKLEYVRQAVSLVVDQMEPTDYLSVVAFDDKVSVIVPSQPAADKAHIKAQVAKVREGGGTAMSLGIQAGLAEIRKQLQMNAVHRLVLLTDGETFGDELVCRNFADDAARQHIAIHPMGLGADWNEDLLHEMGRRSGGPDAEYIQHPADALRLFQQQFQSASNVVVRNAHLTLRTSMGVTPRKVVKVLPLISDLGTSVMQDRSVEVALGEMERDQPQAVLIELNVPPKTEGAFRLAMAELSYDAPSAGVVGEVTRLDVVARFSSNPAESQRVNPQVMNFAEKANAHRLVTRVLDEYKKTGRVTVKLAPNVTRVLDPETQQALSQLTSGQDITPDQVKSIGNKTRKLTQRLDE